jgi:hypothetical protein
MSITSCIEILKRANLGPEAAEAAAEMERQVRVLRDIMDSYSGGVRPK